MGFVCLFIGFTGQFLGYTGWLKESSDDTPVIVVPIGLVAFLALFYCVRRISRWTSRRAVSREWGEGLLKNLGPDRTVKDPTEFAKQCEFYGIASIYLAIRAKTLRRLQTASARLLSAGRRCPSRALLSSSSSSLTTTRGSCAS